MKHWKLYDGYILEWPETGYTVNLKNMQTSAAMLDVIFQVSNKLWCTPWCIRNLMDNLQMLVNPQAALCSGGSEKGPVKIVPKVPKDYDGRDPMGRFECRDDRALTFGEWLKEGGEL